jgi:hypothetical protein
MALVSFVMYMLPAVAVEYSSLVGLEVLSTQDADSSCGTRFRFGT